MQDGESDGKNENQNKEKDSTEKEDENAEGEPSPSANSSNNAVPEELAATAVNSLDDDKEVESDAGDDDDEAKENYEGFNGTGRTVTLQMLMGANVLQPGKSTMTIEYLGQKFVGDLLPDGKIKSQETETIFLTPSAWAMHCKRIINPEKKSGCGWASVKYKGKKLDAYKNSWLRKCALQKESTPDECEQDMDKKSDSPLPVVKRTVYQHNTISNRNIMHDANMLIEAVPFTSVGKLQPFLLTISSSALLLTDFHCHLSMREICGYLGGTWDVNSHTLAITKAYPCRNTRFDRQKAAEVEREIQKLMLRDQLILVGWYHSHPQFQAEPTLRDCDSQLEYQIRMRGPTEATYTPCVSLLVSPYYDENPTLESVVKAIWVVPPNENKQSVEYGRPMLMQYSVLPDKEVPEEVRTEIQSCVDYYSQFRNEIVKFRNMFNEDTTYIEKLKNTLYPKFPLKQNDKALWNWMCAVLDCEQEDDFIPPKTIKIIDVDSSNKEEIKPEALLNTNAINDLKTEDSKEDILLAEQKSNELKVMSLQEQLCLPSGLNMNPVRMLSPLATPNPTVVAGGTTTPTVPAINASAAASAIPSLPAIIPPAILPGLPLATTTANFPLVTAQAPPQTAAAPVNLPQLPNQLPVTLTGASPRDSPITIPSNSASPAKFEVPRASPSPAKSDTSSSHTSRTRNSPAPSPGKFSISDLARNSPTGSIAPPTTAAAAGLIPPSAACLPTANDLMAASLAQLAGQLPPNFLQSDIAAALFQQQRGPGAGMSNSSLNQLAAAAAKVGGQKGGAGSGLPDLHDPNVAAAAAAAFSNTFNMPPRLPESSAARTTKAERSSKSSGSSSSSSSSSNSSSNSYKTKLMKELDDLKNDPLKMGELMRSPEYAALLLQQAEALGATTLGTLGFGTDFSYLTGANLGLTSPASNNQSNSGPSSSNNSNSKSKAAAAASAAALTADYNNLIQASKLLGYDAYMQQMAAAAVAAASVPPPSSPSNSKKQQQAAQQQQHPDYTALLQTYSKLFDPGNQLSAALAPGKGTASAGMHHELSALLAGGLGGLIPTGNSNASTSNSAKQKQQQKQQQQQQQQQQQEMQQQQTDMLNQLLQSEKQQSELSAAILYHQNKAAADLNALFATPPVGAGSVGGGKSGGNNGSGSAANSTGAPSPLTDPAAYYNALAQEKMQDYAAFFQQHHGKYGSIPDPLSKSTLAANNLFMSPSALLKIQQESLSAMMMKPPKSTTPSGSTSAGSLTGRGGRESSASPALERLTPTKSATSGSKYNFSSAVDLAISSVPSNTPSPAPSDGSNSSSHRRPSNTPPVDLSRLYGGLQNLEPHTLAGKKRMEFSSIADLAAPPPAKVPKTSDDVLNLSNE